MTGPNREKASECMNATLKRLMDFSILYNGDLGIDAPM